jgi:cation/acetate symporter
MNNHGAVSGMIAGITFTSLYIAYFKFLHPELNTAEHWWLGVSPEGIGTIGMALNFLVAWVVAAFTEPPPLEIQQFVEEIRVPRKS